MSLLDNDFDIIESLCLKYVKSKFLTLGKNTWSWENEYDINNLLEHPDEYRILVVEYLQQNYVTVKLLHDSEKSPISVGYVSEMKPNENKMYHFIYDRVIINGEQLHGLHFITLKHILDGIAG